MGRDLTNEDTYFCKKAQELGFKIYADMEACLDHWTPMSLRPVQTPTGEWTVAINMGDDIQVALPPSYLQLMAGSVKEHNKDNFDKSLFH